MSCQGKQDEEYTRKLKKALFNELCIDSIVDYGEQCRTDGRKKMNDYFRDSKKHIILLYLRIYLPGNIPEQLLNLIFSMYMDTLIIPMGDDHGFIHVFVPGLSPSSGDSTTTTFERKMELNGYNNSIHELLKKEIYFAKVLYTAHFTLIYCPGSKSLLIHHGGAWKIIHGADKIHKICSREVSSHCLILFENQTAVHCYTRYVRRRDYGFVAEEILMEEEKNVKEIHCSRLLWVWKRDNKVKIFTGGRRSLIPKDIKEIEKMFFHRVLPTVCGFFGLDREGIWHYCGLSQKVYDALEISDTKSNKYEVENVYNLKDRSLVMLQNNEETKFLFLGYEWETSNFQKDKLTSFMKSTKVSKIWYNEMGVFAGHGDGVRLFYHYQDEGNYKDINTKNDLFITSNSYKSIENIQTIDKVKKVMQKGAHIEDIVTYEIGDIGQEKYGFYIRFTNGNVVAWMENDADSFVLFDDIVEDIVLSHYYMLLKLQNGDIRSYGSDIPLLVQQRLKVLMERGIGVYKIHSDKEGFLLEMTDGSVVVDRWKHCLHRS